MKKDLNNKAHHPLDDLRAPDGCIYMDDDMSYLDKLKLIKVSRELIRKFSNEQIQNLIEQGVEIVDGPVLEEDMYITIDSKE